MPSYRGYVYLIGSSQFGWYKIGQSKSAAVRIRTLGVLLPFKIEVFAVWKTDNPGRLEAAMHERYAEHHLNGEWFSFAWDQMMGAVAAETPYPSVRLQEKDSGSLYEFSNLVANRILGRLSHEPKMGTPPKEKPQKRESVRKERNALPRLLGGLHFGNWIDQYLADTGLERTKENMALARKEVYKLFESNKEKVGAV